MLNNVVTCLLVICVDVRKEIPLVSAAVQVSTVIKREQKPQSKGRGVIRPSYTLPRYMRRGL